MEDGQLSIEPDKERQRGGRITDMSNLLVTFGTTRDVPPPPAPPFSLLTSNALANW